MTNRLSVCFLFLGVLQLCLCSAVSDGPTFGSRGGRGEIRNASSRFWKGLSGIDYSLPKVSSLLQQVGVTHARVYVLWSGVEPVLTSVNASLTVASLRADPNGTIYAWAAEKDWSWADAQIKTLVASGVRPLIEVGEGTHWGLPRVHINQTATTLADPSVIGIEPYLAYQYRFCRAVANRYKGVVRLYQIENELNEAFLEGYYGQRLKAPLWGNWTFLTLLLETLSAAIKDEEPKLRITTNIHTDVPKVIHEFMKLPGYFVDAAAQWGPLLDLVSFDAYPNMYIAAPNLAAVVGQRARAIMNVTTKPVFIMETGYPVNADSNVPPYAAFNFTQERQAQYVTDVVAAARAAGCKGLFYFDFTAAPGMVAPPGGYTSADASMMAAMDAFLLSNNVTALLDWLSAPGDYEEFKTRAAYFIGAPDAGGWGLFTPTFVPRLAVAAMTAAFASV